MKKLMKFNKIYQLPTMTTFTILTHWSPKFTRNEIYPPPPWMAGDDPGSVD